ncbi:MAG TPA: response regulator [Flavobacterium sp.]|jgi:CheY-like chemotaxis protein
MSERNNIHIIIAEDDEDDGEIMLESFGKHDSFARIDWVRNGRELIDFLNEHDKKPDIILTDINMPILSGIEALELICGDNKLNGIPAFVFSSTLNPVYEVKCMQLGTKGFLIKPLNLKGFDEIPSKIINILKKSDKG